MSDTPIELVDQDDPQTQVLVWNMAGLLEFNRSTQLWLGDGEPLPDDLQAAARQLVAAGFLPEFAADVNGKG